MSYNTLFNYFIVFFSAINNTNGGNQLDEFKNPCSINYIVFGLSKYNINFIQSTFSQCSDIEHYEYKFVNNKESIQLLQNSLYQEVQSCTTLNNSKPDMIGLHYNKMNFINSLLLCCWLRLNLTNKNTGSICSGMEIQKCSEQIRYFTHTPFLLVELS